MQGKWFSIETSAAHELRLQHQIKVGQIGISLLHLIKNGCIADALKRKIGGGFYVVLTLSLNEKNPTCMT